MTAAAYENDSESVLTLYWGRLEDGHYRGVLPDGTSVVAATEIGLHSAMCCRARATWPGRLRLAFIGVMRQSAESPEG